MKTEGKGRQLAENFQLEELYNLCDKRQITCTREEALERIREWLHRNKDDNTRLKKALTYKGEYTNWTPLHRILQLQPPIDIIQKFIDYAPETLQMKDIFGYLPIHIACMDGASLEVIQALVNSYPESITVDFRGYLPLHLACQSNASLEVLNFLINSYPDGIDQTNIIDHKTPLDLLKESEYIMRQDSNGMLPMHHACNNGYSLHLIHLLIQAYPESTTVQDNDGYTPGQYLSKTASVADEKGMLLLHREASHFSGLNVELLPILLRAYPEAIRFHDKLGLLPIHHASLNEASSLDALMLLLKFYPESIAV